MTEASIATLDACDDATLHRLAEQVGDRLRANHHTMCTAESCTGGWISKMITDIPGCSDWFECGVAAYSYEAKQALLGVRPETLTQHGAVSRETVLEMVSGALITSGATNYRRWTNFAWAVVERGGQAEAGDWSADDDRRLRTIVERAHELGLWVRFYTLNGHPAGTGLGWTESYNFGSIDAVRARWRAAIAAGVDFIATDQYEEFR